MNICKNGNILATVFATSPIINMYDSNFYTESDGSVWVRVFHHTPVLSDGSFNLFSKSDSFATHVCKNENAWFNVSLCNYNTSGKWELMTIQKNITESNPDFKYRFIQNVNPMTTAFADVDHDDVEVYTGDGYWTSSSYGGVYLKKSSTYLCMNNTNSSNRWGAIGCWNKYNGGIPAALGEVVIDGYYDLYYRIDTEITSKCTFNESGISSADFIEF